MFIVHATVMEFKHCAKTNFEFKHSEEAQLGNMATLVADSAFHGLTYPENFCVGSLWQRYASLWMLIFFSCIFFSDSFPKKARIKAFNTENWDRGS